MIIEARETAVCIGMYRFASNTILKRVEGISLNTEIVLIDKMYLRLSQEHLNNNRYNYA